MIQAIINTNDYTTSEQDINGKCAANLIKLSTHITARLLNEHDSETDYANHFCFTANLIIMMTVVTRMIIGQSFTKNRIISPNTEAPS